MFIKPVSPGKLMNMNKIFIRSIFVFIIVASIPSVNSSTNDFTINSLEMHILLEDDGDVLITEISTIEIESPKSSIKYDLFTQTPLEIESVKFNGKYQEFNEIKNFPWGKTDLFIQMDSNLREGKLEVLYTTKIQNSFQQDESEIFISRFYLRNFEKLDKSIAEIPVTIEIPKSFDIKFDGKIITNLRYSSSNNLSDLNTYYHSLNVFEQHISENKRYITILSTKDIYRYEDTTSLLFDVEFVLIIAKDFPYNDFIDYYKIEIDANDLENIIAEIKINELKLSNSKTNISFFPSENSISVNASPYFDIEIDKDKENESIVWIYPKEMEEIIGTTWLYTLEYTIKYDKFVRYQTYFYDVFYWKESFFPNPRVFRFTLKIPNTVILLETSPKGAIIQNSISWSENSLPLDPHRSQIYSVKFIPMEKHKKILWIFFLLTLISGLFYIVGTRYLIFNKYFTGYLMGWASSVLLFWVFIGLDPIFYDLLVLSQIFILLFFAYIYGDKPRFYRLSLASLIILLWFYQDIFAFLETIGRIVGEFLDFQDIGSKIFFAVVIFFAGRYGKSFARKCILFVRNNAKNMFWINIFAFFVFIILYFARIPNEYLFETKISFSNFFGLMMLILMISPEDSTYHIKCKVQDVIIKRNDVCFFKCCLTEIQPTTPFSRKLKAKETLWAKFSNKNGYSVKGLNIDEIKVGQDLEIYGDWIMQKDLPREDAAIIRGIKGMIEVIKVHIEKKSPIGDLRYLKNKISYRKLKILPLDFFIDDEDSIIFRIVYGERDEPYASQIMRNIGTIIDGIDKTEIMKISEEFDEDDMKNFNLILVGTTPNNQYMYRFVREKIKSDDKSSSNWMIHSDGTYKYYSDPYNLGTDVVVISGSDNMKVEEGVQKFIDFCLSKYGK